VFVVEKRMRLGYRKETRGPSTSFGFASLRSG